LSFESLHDRDPGRSSCNCHRQGVTLSAVGSILTPDFKHALNGRSVVLQRVDGDGYEALVDAQSRALAAFSIDTADAIMSVVQKKPRVTDRIFEAKGEPRGSNALDLTRN
jgi:hypothetical protein